MKKFIALIMALLMLGACLVSCNNTPDPSTDDTTDTDVSADSLVYPLVDPADATLFVGYAREDITPPDEMISSVTLTGYAEGRPISEVESNLYVSCTAFKDAEGDIALVYTLDLHAIAPSQSTALAGAVTRATKVAKSNIIFNVTHNHNAPNTGGIYLSDVITPAVVKVAEDAIADLKACTALFAGEINMKNYSFIRRYIYDSKGNPIEHEHEMDSMIPVARFVRDGGKDVLLVNFAAHCDTVTSRSMEILSADYVAAFRRVVENELDVHFSMQLGATGDVNPMTRIDEPSFYSSTDNYGRNLAYKIINEFKKLPQIEIKGDVEAKSSTARVEFDHSTDHLADKADEVMALYYASEDKTESEAKMKEYGIASVYEAMYISARAKAGEYERRNVSAISIGNIVFAAADYEMFSQTGRNIKDAGNENFDLTFMCAYSNGMIGYIPAEYAFANGGYEVYSCQYVPGSAEIIEAKIIDLMNELAAK